MKNIHIDNSQMELQELEKEDSFFTVLFSAILGLLDIIRGSFPLVPVGLDELRLAYYRTVLQVPRYGEKQRIEDIVEVFDRLRVETEFEHRNDNTI
jgi:hypothetical protein